MEPGWPLSFLTLPVSDLERARRFYVALGLAPAPRSPARCAFFALPGATLALVEAGLFSEECGLDAVPAGGAGFSWNVAESRDVMAVLAMAGEAGGRVLRPPTATSWGGLRGWFADPDGHRWEAVWNPKAARPPWMRRS